MDDFSFPTITDQDPLCQQLPFPHFTASPLWFDCRLRRSLSSVEEAFDCRLRRSLSSAEGAAKMVEALNSVMLSYEDEGEGEGRCAIDDDNHEQKMDMLWEEFNEELRRVSCELKKDSKGEQQALGAAASSSSKGATRLLQQRRPGFVVMLKMWRKLFLQKNNSTKRRTSLFQKQL